MNLPLQRGEIQQVKAGVRKKREELKNKEGDTEAGKTVFYSFPPQISVSACFLWANKPTECERCFILKKKKKIFLIKRIHFGGKKLKSYLLIEPDW